ncbi:MAG: response regulator transcription factor [Cryomorphaceae bacterium]|nr:response regulator transcription factor [Flavobacteriales bacterium]
MKKDIAILLAEDDPGLGFVIQDTLRENGYTVHLCRDGHEALKQFSDRSYDICVLDVMMPKKDGFELARDIRKINTDVPIVFLTAKSMTTDKVEGFKSGADDYITKPFSNEEFLLRIEAILRRTTGMGSEPVPSVFEIGMYRFDADNFELTADGQSRTLTRKEAGILKLLSERRNKVVERELITTIVWGEDSYFVGRSLDVFITKLRKYLGDDDAVNIANVHGVGFKLEC